MSILVAAPTAESKDYSLVAYLDAYHALDYPSKNLFMVDTTPSLSYTHRLREFGVEHAYIGWEKTEFDESHLIHNVDRAWAVIIQYAYATGHEWILSIETDIIVPPHTATRLLSVATSLDAWVVSHSYPQRGCDDNFLMTALGCTLFRRNIFPPNCQLEDIEANHFMESSLFNVPRQMGCVVVSIDNLLSIKHLDSEDRR
jgi:hypothetical protein